MIPDITPWSYPKSRNPVVEMVEMRSPSLRPLSPPKVRTVFTVCMLPGMFAVFVWYISEQKLLLAQPGCSKEASTTLLRRVPEKSIESFKERGYRRRERERKEWRGAGSYVYTNPFTSPRSIYHMRLRAEYVTRAYPHLFNFGRAKLTILRFTQNPSIHATLDHLRPVTQDSRSPSKISGFFLRYSTIDNVIHEVGEDGEES